MYDRIFHTCFVLGQLKDLVGSHELGLSIQQETPQLLMEGDTLDDQDVSCSNTAVQEEGVAFPYERDTTRPLMPTATVPSQLKINDQSPVKKRTRSLLTVVSPQSTDCLNALLDPVILSHLCTSGCKTMSTNTTVGDVSSPVATTSSLTNCSSIANNNSAHVSSSVVTMRTSVSSAVYSSSPVNLSCTLALATAPPCSVITSLPLSLEPSSVTVPSSSAERCSNNHGCSVNASSHKCGKCFIIFTFTSCEHCGYSCTGIQRGYFKNLVM